MYLKEVLRQKKYVLSNVFFKSTVNEYTYITQKYFTHENKTSLLL